MTRMYRNHQYCVSRQ